MLLKKLVYSSYFLLILSLFASCGAGFTCNSTLEASEKYYKNWKNGLYEDANGEFYFRTIDYSYGVDENCPQSGPIYRYSKYVLKDTTIAGNESYINLTIKEVVDPTSFVEIENSDSSRPLRYFKDKNHEYYLIPLSDGGVLRWKQP